MTMQSRSFLWALALLSLGACAPTGQTGGVPLAEVARPEVSIAASALRDDQAQIAALTDAILAMGPGVDPEESARAARVTYVSVAELRAAYQITDGPMIHNMKVNSGIKPRGLCWHWALDLEARLQAEGFRTLDLHQAIANYNNLRLEHSTAIVSAKGASMYDGIVLDPWRDGGVLTWKAVRADTRYNWTPRAEVFDWKRARGLLKTRYVELAEGR
ncbi:MAG: hypothetical protein AAFY65_14120 [Pseudomonadota bacterium]